MTSPGPHHDVQSLIAAEPVDSDDAPDLAGWMQRLCRAATRDLLVAGVAVSIMSPPGRTTVVAASGGAWEVVEQLQFTLGEGPCLDAYALGRPVLTSDLSEAARTQWPGYAPAALDHGVCAVFAFPLQVGAVRLGAMGVYQQRLGPLPGQALTAALGFAEVAMSALLDAQDRVGANRPSTVAVALDGRFEVYQAQGMVQVQLGVSLGEALVRLRSYAYAHDRPLSEVAADVVARILLFDPDS